jgi:ribosome-binding factor A
MKKSNKTLRLTGVSQNETAEQIKTQARADLQVNGPNRKSFLKIFSRQISNNPVASADMIITSVAQQKDLKTATITFPTSTEKEKALAKMRKKRNGAWGGAYIDDDFRGITILHSGSSGQRVDLEYASHPFCGSSITLMILQYLCRSRSQRARI